MTTGISDSYSYTRLLYTNFPSQTNFLLVIIEISNIHELWTKRGKVFQMILKISNYFRL